MLDSAGSTLVEWGRQQQQHYYDEDDGDDDDCYDDGDCDDDEGDDVDDDGDDEDYDDVDYDDDDDGDDDDDEGDNVDDDGGDYDDEDEGGDDDDYGSNPGPQNRKLPASALTTQTTTLNSTTHSHATTSHHNQKLLTLLQLNINSITNKHEELKLLVTELQPDIITIQETKLKKHNKAPQIPTYSAIRTDRANGKGGGLLTYIKHNITFSDTKFPNFINPINTELQIIQLHITNNKKFTPSQIYTSPLGTPLARITPPVMLISHLAFNT